MTQRLLIAFVLLCWWPAVAQAPIPDPGVENSRVSLGDTCSFISFTDSNFNHTLEVRWLSDDSLASRTTVTPNGVSVLEKFCDGERSMTVTLYLPPHSTCGCHDDADRPVGQGYARIVIYKDGEIDAITEEHATVGDDSLFRAGS